MIFLYIVDRLGHFPAIRRREKKIPFLFRFQSLCTYSRSFIPLTLALIHCDTLHILKGIAAEHIRRAMKNVFMCIINWLWHQMFYGVFKNIYHHTHAQIPSHSEHMRKLCVNVRYLLDSSQIRWSLSFRSELKFTLDFGKVGDNVCVSPSICSKYMSWLMAIEASSICQSKFLSFELLIQHIWNVNYIQVGLFTINCNYWDLAYSVEYYLENFQIFTFSNFITFLRTYQN